MSKEPKDGGDWSANTFFFTLKPCMDLRITLQLKWDLRVSGFYFIKLYSFSNKSICKNQ